MDENRTKDSKKLPNIYQFRLLVIGIRKTIQEWELKRREIWWRSKMVVYIKKNFIQQFYLKTSSYALLVLLLHSE